ncbi:MAG: hypothetical protein WDM96_05335 [Lacunisphaera sp.]
MKAAAGQFEAIILRQLLQDSVGKLTGGRQVRRRHVRLHAHRRPRQQAHRGRGTGLAKVFQQQLSPKAGKTVAAGEAQGTP